MNPFQGFLGSDIRGECEYTSDCEYLFVCNPNTGCVHDDILSAQWLQICGIIVFMTQGNILIVIIIGISTVGGLGGGIEKVPILMVMLNYSQKSATVFT